MRRHPILSLLAGLYLLVVGLWPTAAVPVALAATGAFTVLAQPPVLLALAVAALAVHYLRRPVHAPGRGH